MRFHTTRLVRAMCVMALLAAPGTALAQSRHGGIGAGIKGGPLFASFDKGSTYSNSNRTGFIGGLFLGGNRPGVVGVGVDLLYAKKNTKDPITGAKIGTDYINVPVYLRINLGSSSTSGVLGYIVAGPDLNFLLKARSGSTDIKGNFERADYGYVVGAGVEITRVILEGRYTKGLGNIAKKTTDPVTKSKSFQIMIGVRFN